jgi:hypothetical protein
LSAKPASSRPKASAALALANASPLAAGSFVADAYTV